MLKIKKLSSVLLISLLFSGSYADVIGNPKLNYKKYFSTGTSGVVELGLIGQSVTISSLLVNDNDGVFVFGSVSNGPYGTNQNPTTNAFLTKYDGNLNLVWSEQDNYNGNTQVFGRAMTIDDADNIIVAENIDGYDSTVVTKMFNRGKSTSLEKPAWISVLGQGRKGPYSFANEPSGYAFMASNADNVGLVDKIDIASGNQTRNITLNLDPAVPTTINDVTTYTNKNNKTDVILAGILLGNYFVSKYDADLNLLWTQVGNTSAPSFGNAVATDSKGNIYVVGSNMLPIPNQPRKYYTAYAIMQLTPDGKTGWVRQVGSADFMGSTAAYAVAIDKYDNIYLTGGTNSALAGQTKTSSKDYNDTFVVKYSNTGNLLWTKEFGVAAQSVIGTKIAVYNSKVYVAGIVSDGTSSIYSYLTSLQDN